MDARSSTGRWTWRERLWLLAFLVTQLAGLWQCFGHWFFSSGFFGSLVAHGR